MTSDISVPKPDAPDASPAPTRLRVDDRVFTPTAPDVALAIATTSTPRLSWVVPLVRDGQAQTAYQIRAARSADPRRKADAWDSGVVDSPENSDIHWGGDPLSAYDRLQVVVRTQDEDGQVSDWSEPAIIETGPLERADWDARWIAFPAAHAASADFTLPAGVAVRRAVVHIAGHAAVRLVVDAEPVNPDARDLTDASLTRATSRSYDVTALLAGSSEHRLSVVATIGHYRKVLTRPRVIVMLRIQLADDTVRDIGSGSSWTHLPTSVVRDEPFYLEEHDTAVADHWSTPGTVGEPVTVLDEVAAGAVPGRDGAPGVIAPDAGPPVRIVRRCEAVPLSMTDDARVYDLGENVTGRSRVQLPASVAGERVTVVHGEKLDARGRVDTTNIRMPDDVERERQVIAWHCDGSAATIEAWFAVAGFRYIEVRGYTGTDEPRVSAGVVHSDGPRTGWVETDVPELDAVVDAAVRTQLNNSAGFPSDCPTRERAGWTGDASASVEAALCHLGLEGMYRNWLVDVVLDANDGGGIRGVAPNLLGPREEQGADPVWGSALNEIMWQLWWQTGDTSTLRPLMPALRRWADWQLGTLEDGLVRHADLSFGADWLALEQTPPVLLQTAAVIVCLGQLATLEDTMGDPDASQLRRSQAQEIVDAARRRLRDPVDHTWGNDSQGSSGVALVSGLAEQSDIPVLRARLQRAVAARGDRLATGFSATRAVVRALADTDGGTALLRCIRQPEQPGVGSMLVDGPGTFWETWWIDDENVGVASLDHIGLAAPFAAWAWSHAAGLRPLEPGFRRFALAPRLLGDVDHARLTRDTPRGRIDIDWTYADGTFRAAITVPVGSTCILSLPGHADTELGSGRHDVRIADVIPPAPIPPAISTPEQERRGETWLSDGETSVWRATGDITVELVEVDTFCTPVYHEPMPAPSLAITVSPFLPDTEYWIELEHDHPLDLSGASFVYASFDLDQAGLTGRALRPLLRVTAGDGDTRVGTTRPLPIAWNRVAVDVADWSGRRDVHRIEVGIAWTDRHDSARGPYVALPDDPTAFAFRVGRVGWTDAPRTY